MTNIIGPIDMASFYTMGMLRQNVREMSKLNDGQYEIAINKQKSILREFFDEILDRKEKEDNAVKAAAA